MAFFTGNHSNNKPKPQSDSDRTRKELNAHKQLGRFDSHFNDPGTTVRLDSTYSSKDGKKKSRYIISQNGCEKYEAKFVQKDNKQKLEKIVSIRHTVKKPKAAKDKKQ